MALSEYCLYSAEIVYVQLGTLWFSCQLPAARDILLLFQYPVHWSAQPSRHLTSCLIWWAALFIYPWVLYIYYHCLDVPCLEKVDWATHWKWRVKDQERLQRFSKLFTTSNISNSFKICAPAKINWFVSIVCGLLPLDIMLSVWNIFLWSPSHVQILSVLQGPLQMSLPSPMLLGGLKSRKSLLKYNKWRIDYIFGYINSSLEGSSWKQSLLSMNSYSKFVYNPKHLFLTFIKYAWCPIY